jgi:hypothetical protein
MGYDLLADVVVAVHLGYVSYVVVGEAAIVLGLVRKWQWIRNPWFRLSHLAAIVIVAAEALLEIPCPLTEWEDRLRRLAGHAVEEGSFVGRILDQLMFFDFEPSFFKWLYVGFAILVVLTLVLAPPQWRKGPADQGA